jgi:hypothetical protein
MVAVAPEQDKKWPLFVCERKHHHNRPADRDSLASGLVFATRA